MQSHHFELTKRLFAFASAAVLVIGVFAARALPQHPAQPQSQTEIKNAQFVDLLISGGTIVTMDPERRILENGFLVVKGDTIVAIGQGVPRLPAGPIFAKQAIDVKGGLILP